MGPKDQILTRMYMVMTLLSVVPVFVVGQIGWVLLSRGGDLQEQGEQQAQSTVEIPAMRGAILDRNGRALAINTARYDLALDPTVGNFEARASTFYERLESLTGEPADRFRRKVEERYSPQYVRLYRGLTAEEREEVESWGIKGVILTPRFARRYNHGSTAAHVLGHVDSEGNGLAGLELEYDEHLTGTPGRRAVKRDRSGRIKAFVGGKVVEPRHGESLRLTIDLARQAALEDELRRGVEESGAAWGTAVAMDPNTGAVLGMANVPTYNPNRPGDASNDERRNRAITDRFEPGSTFKLVGAAAAVGQDVVSMTDSIETGDGWAVFHGYTMKDVRAHGTISFSDVIAKSSNVGMAKTATRLDPGTYYQYARNLGFGQPTMIDLPGEVGGVLKRPSQWSSTTLTSMSIGYEVAVTPIQLLAAYSALANGGQLVEPYLVAERQDITGTTQWTNRTDSIRRAISKETARTLRPAFEDVVEYGTGTQAGIDGLSVAGKTGTALKVADGDYSADLARASFVGFFPADDPSVALLVIIGEPETSIYGGQVAAPVFRRIARRWADTFPRVTDRLARAADSSVASADADRVAAAADEAPGDMPDRLAEASSDAMPDLRGLSARQAVYWLRRHGVAVRVRGEGVVAGQDPAPGEALSGRALLRCTTDPAAGAR